MFTGAPGLYAAGEVASGVFGANRVADAVTEMIVQGYKAGEVAARCAAGEGLVETDNQSLTSAVATLEKSLENNSDISAGGLSQEA